MKKISPSVRGYLDGSAPPFGGYDSGQERITKAVPGLEEEARCHRQKSRAWIRERAVQRRAVRAACRLWAGEL
jgi:hypothetical protein